MPESIWKLLDAWNDKADQSCQNCVANVLTAIEDFFFPPVRNSVKCNYKWNPFKHLSLQD